MTAPAPQQSLGGITSITPPAGSKLSSTAYMMIKLGRSEIKQDKNVVISPEMQTTIDKINIQIARIDKKVATAKNNLLTLASATKDRNDINNLLPKFPPEVLRDLGQRYNDSNIQYGKQLIELEQGSAEIKKKYDEYMQEKVRIRTTLGQGKLPTDTEVEKLFNLYLTVENNVKAINPKITELKNNYKTLVGLVEKVVPSTEKKHTDSLRPE